MSRIKDLSGQRFGKLNVLFICGKDGRKYRWFAVCDCGNHTTVTGTAISGGRTKSCGCGVVGSITTHNMSKTPEWRAWTDMKKRCTKPKNKNYHHYGGRGITVCDRWLESFENFYADMGPRPAGMSIERKKNHLGYSPENCILATHSEQMRNTRKSKMLTFNGVTKNMTTWSEDVGIKSATINARLRRGWSVEKALNTPVDGE